MFTVKELLRFWGLLKPTPESQHNWVMERDLGKLTDHVKKHFPEAYAAFAVVQHGMLWAVHRSPKHQPFSVKSTELEAWQDAAQWIPRSK